MIELVRRVSTAEAVANHLVDRIRSGDFGPGDNLPSERELQQQMGVGRLAVREGLARLSALGIVQVDHGRGTKIRQGVQTEALDQIFVPMFPDRHPKAMEDLLRARSAIDSELASLAARRRTDEDVRILAALLRDTDKALNDDEALAQLDFDFHREVARIADNSYLGPVHDALARPIKEYLLCYVRIHKNRREVVSRHIPILEAIRAQNPDGARRAALRHLEACKSSVDSFISEHQDGSN